MRKGWMVLLAMALVVALAVPASAEMKLLVYRVKFVEQLPARAI
jgi:hypothetical protein